MNDAVIPDVSLLIGFVAAVFSWSCSVCVVTATMATAVNSKSATHIHATVIVPVAAVTYR